MRKIKHEKAQVTASSLMEVGARFIEHAPEDLTTDEVREILRYPKEFADFAWGTIQNYLKKLSPPLAERICRGRFDHINWGIDEKNHPRVFCDSEYTLETVQPRKCMYISDMREYVEKLGPQFELADVYDLADYSFDHPEPCFKFPTFAFGSLKRRPGGGWLAAYICEDVNGKRKLDVCCCNNGCDKNSNFLIRRKKSA